MKKISLLLAVMVMLAATGFANVQVQNQPEAKVEKTEKVEKKAKKTVHHKKAKKAKKEEAK